ncbi:MAG: prepilin-type N-terminal cleavage/methylation domain-containing protein [Planctomycetes bacterium]|nr:prepilin-type N-terminal cleavage/methylation domain-containing protein [Planctomycetota bacterium]MBL7142852.1 prepilin-type N-terminal cleavage/methylation domain-containing protein [Phycisphaerae bacterium]
MCRKLTRLLRIEKPAIRKSGGFTLAEVVIASSILAIAIIPILKALTSANVTSSMIERKTNSLILAQGKLDEIKARSIYDYSSSFAEINSSIEGSYLCNVADSSVNANLRQITVSVGEDLNGNSTLNAGEIEITLSTLVAKRF